MSRNADDESLRRRETARYSLAELELDLTALAMRNLLCIQKKIHKRLERDEVEMSTVLMAAQAIETSMKAFAKLTGGRTIFDDVE